MVALAMAIAIPCFCSTRANRSKGRETVTALSDSCFTLGLLGYSCASAMGGAFGGRCPLQNASSMAATHAPCKLRFDWGKSRHRYGHSAAQDLPQKDQTKRESDSNNATRTQ
ncbi:hypothetical protein BDP81DRAFT_118266 [Colletotrichum phormii]|uniref:Uncharacterized protein n=1 Tax=Colletotrichum phormii TaxID=359342 RepID=A0AAI9ZHV7_9PEZI|nr:uncharacterized protein BDP81DRAFT_118266 [Colletotrichum phormii]KAK1623860.1 hypothetical protein BDP81DRAFT_118266 [Colletotrichum phormii]